MKRAIQDNISVTPRFSILLPFQKTRSLQHLALPLDHGAALSTTRDRDHRARAPALASGLDQGSRFLIATHDEPRGQPEARRDRPGTCARCARAGGAAYRLCGTGTRTTLDERRPQRHRALLSRAAGGLPHRDEHHAPGAALVVCHGGCRPARRTALRAGRAVVRGRRCGRWRGW